MAVSDNDNTILILFSGSRHSFWSDRTIDICSRARAQNFSSVKAEVVATGTISNINQHAA